MSVQASGGLRAWVDESEPDQTRDPGTYVLAAAIAPVEQGDAVREHLLRLRSGGPKLHWRDESTTRRIQITRTVRECDLHHLVVVHTGPASDRPERRRRKCLERLTYELEQRGVRDLCFESRGPADDRRDLEMLNALKGQHRVSTGVRISHAVGRHEPMLWVADAVCGAVTSSRKGDGRYADMLAEQLVVVSM